MFSNSLGVNVFIFELNAFDCFGGTGSAFGIGDARDEVLDISVSFCNGKFCLMMSLISVMNFDW